MMYLERKPGGPITLVIECTNPGTTNIALTALDCFSWDPEMHDDPDVAKAIDVLNEDDSLDDGKKIILVAKGKKRRVIE